VKERESRDVIWGGGRGWAFAPLNFKKRDFCVFAYTILFFFIFCPPPPRKLVKILAPLLEKAGMTSLRERFYCKTNQF